MVCDMANLTVLQGNWCTQGLVLVIEQAYDLTMTTPATSTPSVEGPVARVEHFLDWLGSVDGDAMTDRSRLELIAALERVKGAAAGAQAKVTVAFAESQRDEHVARGGKAAEASRTIGAQVALARKDSPTLGDRHVGLARALVTELPGTLRALAAGEVSEFRATIVARETATLSPEDRAIADERLAADLPRLGTRAIAGAARRLAAELDAASVVQQHERAVAARRVSVRPAPAGMAYLTFLAPLRDAVAAYAAAGRLADSSLAGDGVAPADRSRGQLMVDLALDRILGRGDEQNVAVEIQLVMTDAALFGDPTVDRAATEPALISGFGPIPASLARSMVRDADKAWVRRLFTSPESRHLVAMDSKRRLFDGSLRHLLILRDQTCRTPWCEAPIRHVDHAQRAREGGPTSAANGDGLCARCNLTKEAPGWQTEVVATGLDPSGQRPHEITLTTPTGLSYQSTAPPLLGWGSSPPPKDSAFERHLVSLLQAA